MSACNELTVRIGWVLKTWGGANDFNSNAVSDLKANVQVQRRRQTYAGMYGWASASERLRKF